MVMSNKAEWDLEGQCWKQPPGDGSPSSGEGVPLPPSPLGKLPGDRLLFSIMAGMAALLLLGGFVLMVAEFGEGSDEEEMGIADSSEEDFEEEDMEEEDWFDWEDEPDEDSDEEDTDFYFFDWYEDSEGSALYVPEDWERSSKRNESGVIYTSTEDERYLLQVMWDQGSSDSSMEVLERRVHNDVSLHDGYEEIRLKETSDGDAEFEYVYDHGTHGPRRVMVTAFDLAGSTTYMVLSVGPEYAGDAIAEVHDEAVSSFCDEDGTCRGDV